MYEELRLLGVRLGSQSRVIPQKEIQCGATMLMYEYTISGTKGGVAVWSRGQDFCPRGSDPLKQTWFSPERDEKLILVQPWSENAGGWGQGY